jgi:hypothetical protein
MSVSSKAHAGCAVHRRDAAPGRALHVIAGARVAGTDHDGGLPSHGWVGRVGQLTTIQSMLVDGSCFYRIEVIDLDDRGQILGRGYRCEGGSPRAFLFEPVKASR